MKTFLYSLFNGTDGETRTLTLKALVSKTNVSTIPPHPHNSQLGDSVASPPTVSRTTCAEQAPRQSGLYHKAPRTFSPFGGDILHLLRLSRRDHLPLSTRYSMVVSRASLSSRKDNQSSSSLHRASRILAAPAESNRRITTQLSLLHPEEVMVVTHQLGLAT